MAGSHDKSSQYPLIVNPRANRFTLAQFVTTRSAQIKTISNIADVFALNDAVRENLHGLVLELGLQQRMFKGALEPKP